MTHSPPGDWNLLPYLDIDSDDVRYPFPFGDGPPSDNESDDEITDAYKLRYYSEVKLVQRAFNAFRKEIFQGQCRRIHFALEKKFKLPQVCVEQVARLLRPISSQFTKWKKVGRTMWLHANSPVSMDLLLHGNPVFFVRDDGELEPYPQSLRNVLNLENAQFAQMAQ